MLPCVTRAVLNEKFHLISSSSAIIFFSNINSFFKPQGVNSCLILVGNILKFVLLIFFPHFNSASAVNRLFSRGSALI